MLGSVNRSKRIWGTVAICSRGDCLKSIARSSEAGLFQAANFMVKLQAFAIDCRLLAR